MTGRHATGDLPHLFERFWRREPDRGRGSGGTGLGLAIVKAIAEAHDGSVEVTARPGRGAAFRLRLPHFVASARPEVESAPVEIPTMADGSGGIRRLRASVRGDGRSGRGSSEAIAGGPGRHPAGLRTT